MGFSIKIAPGVRVRASSRGVRTSIGPRAARIHVGAGRTGVSTGAGPVGFYTSLGGGSTRSRSPRTSTTTATRSLAAAEKAQQARDLLAAFRAIDDLHRPHFPPAEPPVAPAPPPVDREALRRRHREAATKGISWFARAARKQATAAADAAADREAVVLERQRAEQRQAQQRELDAIWQRLLTNDPDVVLATLAEAFEDNEAAAAAVGIDDGEVSLLVLVPDTTAVPERKPTTTPAGNLSLKKLTKREAADFYKVVVCGHVLVTVKEAFAVAPALAGARVAAVRVTGDDAYGRPRTEVVLAAHFRRAAFEGVQWATADSPTVVTDTSDELVVKPEGATKALGAIDVSTHEDLAALLAAVDIGELLDQR